MSDSEGCSSVAVQRAILVGGDDDVFASLSAACPCPVERDMCADLGARDLVIIDARGCTPLTTGNAFATCRKIKEDAQVWVLMMVSEGDLYSAEIARFCLANGSFVCKSDGSLVGFEDMLSSLDAQTRKVPVDALLARLERDLEADSRKSDVAFEKMVGAEHSDHLLDLLTDAETGLFDGPFATFKLDEEYKRAMRFHQPLALILLDCGIERWPEALAERRTLLAEVASIFLNECRDIDTLARFTEREFLFLLPGTGSDGATAVARRMLDALAGHHYSSDIKMNPAAGLATVPASGINGKRAFLIKAETCLTAALAGRGEGRLRGSWE